MSLSHTTEPFTDDDDALRRYLAEAHLPSLLPALAQVTGDMSLLRADLAPRTGLDARIQGGLSDEQQATARELAFDALKAFRDGGFKVAPAPTDEQLHQMMSYMTAGGLTEEYFPLLFEELQCSGEDARAPKWTKESIDGNTPFQVAIIGSGMSGILAGIRMKQAHVPFVILEKNADLGGTWFENRYPGARVDSSNHLYSYSFAQRNDWPYHYSTQDVLLDYFRGVAEEYDLRPNIRFSTEVESATWDEAKAAWVLKLRTPGGEETLEVNALVSAVGQLNRPKIPTIAGMNTFEGPAFHSAQWDASVDLAGKRVAVIGTGASASQLIPIVAQQAEHLTIYQRTPNWYIPVPNYHAEVEPGLQWLFRHVPFYAQWYRFSLFWSSTDGLIPMAKVDPEWQPRNLSVSAENQMLRDLMVEYLKAQLEDRPDLLEKVIPQYPPASKRIVLDNGIWAATLRRPNVDLVTTPVKEITPRGVVTEDGTETAVDVIIYGTGFQASRFLTPMKVYGTGGQDLHGQWDGDARAYMGITVPNFPNLFLMYGPNTNIVVNGSIVYFSECEVNYIMGCIRLLLERGLHAMSPKKDVHDAYNVRIDEGNRTMAWGVSTVNSWYKNDYGRVAQNWPFSLLEYWQQTREPNPDDYVLS
ncbi:MAG: NAD(P)/FAD-dependent oxidoreductase [Dehalococcoidia bacterium]|nr:NAD(P)/FAD-dependent oxidoreductase [Dehalococcoidia bacterium]